MTLSASGRSFWIIVDTGGEEEPTKARKTDRQGCGLSWSIHCSLGKSMSACGQVDHVEAEKRTFFCTDGPRHTCLSLSPGHG